ncbi:hypothetical protein GCM10020331_058550 [Ectobacillus funiculus]
MPSIVKGIVISNIDVTGAFNIGDTYEVTPISTEKGLSWSWIIKYWIFCKHI